MREKSKSASGQTKSGQSKRLTGKVGIFWVFHGRVLAATYNLADGEDYGDAVNGRTDHVHYWPKFQEQHPALRELEYQDVPRGRVLFMKPSEKFHVYLDKALRAEKIKRAICQEFELPVAKTKFLSDSHYTTDLEELNRLFDQGG